MQGTWIHSDVTTPGEGGATIGINKQPRKTMRQAYDDALVKGYRKPEESFESYSERAMTEIPSRASSTKRTSRFLPDPVKSNLKPEGIKPLTPEMPKAEPIKPVARPEKLYAVLASARKEGMGIDYVETNSA